MRGVALPGLIGDNYSKIEAKTNTGRDIVIGPFAVSNGSITSQGLTIDSVRLGLLEDEYLVSLKAWQDSLSVGELTQNYVLSHTGYFGRFQNGFEGDVTLSIYDVTDPTNPELFIGANGANSAATSHTTIGWTNFGAGEASLSSTAVDPQDSSGTGSFYPGAGINFSAVYTTGGVVYTQNDGIDPTIYICLPKGIELDESTVMGRSVSGNHGTDTFP